MAGNAPGDHRKKNSSVTQNYEDLKEDVEVHKSTQIRCYWCHLRKTIREHKEKLRLYAERREAASKK